MPHEPTCRNCHGTPVYVMTQRTGASNPLVHHFCHKCVTNNESLLNGKTLLKRYEEHAKWDVAAIRPIPASAEELAAQAELAAAQAEHAAFLATLEQAVAQARADLATDTSTAAPLAQATPELSGVTTAQTATGATMSTDTTNPVVTGRVMAVLENTNEMVVEVNLPGAEKAQLLKTTLMPGQVANNTVHVEVHIEPRARALRTGTPSDLPLTTVFTHSAPAAVAQRTHEAMSSEGLPPGLKFVPKQAHYYVTPQREILMTAMEQMSAHGDFVKAALTGPKGSGKTEFAYEFAHRFNRPFLKVAAGSMQSPDQWFGMRTFRNNEDSFQATAFTRALATPRTLILIDEGNRTHGTNHAPLMSVLDDTKSAWIDEIQTLLEVDPSVIILMSLNIGSQYSGTFDLDAALRDRFPYTLEFDWLPPAEEGKILCLKAGVAPKVAQALVELATEVRRQADPSLPNPLDNTISTRMLLATAKLVAKGGLSAADAVRATILPIFSTDGGAGSQRNTVAGVVQGKFGGA